MKQKRQGVASREHEVVYHAASRCQAAALSLTPGHLHGLKRACSVEGKKTGHFAFQRKALLNCFERMQMSGCLKSRAIIDLMGLEQSENDACPNVREGTNGDAMTFPFCAFAFIVDQGPLLLQRALPGKLMQSIPQRLNASQSPMGFRVVSAGKQDWRGTTKGLQTSSRGVASRIVSDFSEQTRSEAFASSWQATEDLAVFMAQKKLLNLLVIFSDLLYQWQELDNQGHCQASFRPGRDRVGLQTRLMQLLEDLGGYFRGRGVTGGFEDVANLLNRSSLSCLQGRVGLQKDQGRALLQLGKQIQCDGIIGFQTGCKLVDQARLHLDQAILITREPFEFGHLLTIGGESVQICE